MAFTLRTIECQITASPVLCNNAIHYSRSSCWNVQLICFIFILCFSFFFTFFVWTIALKSLPMIVESLSQIELSLINKTKIICQITFSMYKLDMLVIRFMHDK